MYIIKPKKFVVLLVNTDTGVVIEAPIPVTNVNNQPGPPPLIRLGATNDVSYTNTVELPYDRDRLTSNYDHNNRYVYRYNPY